MGYRILHGHGNYAPNKRKSYIAFGGVFKTLKDAKNYSKKNLVGGRFRYVPSSKVKKTRYKKLFYITSNKKPRKRKERFSLFI